MTTPITEVRITFYDTAMALIEIGSLRLLTDPVLDAAGTVYDHGPVQLEKTGPARATRESLGRIDAVLLSHDQHGDNLDHAGRALLSDIATVITTPEAAGRLDGVAAVGLQPWAETTLSGSDGFAVTVTAAPARHGPDGTQEATGPVTGFLLSWPGARNGVYVSGDTVLFEGTQAIVERAAPVGIALLNLGRVRLGPMGPLEFSLGAREAAAYATRLQARPCGAPAHGGVGSLHRGTRGSRHRSRRARCRQLDVAGAGCRPGLLARAVNARWRGA